MDNILLSAHNMLETIEEKILNIDKDCKTDILTHGADILEIFTNIGKYVINVNSVKKEIWLSSPISGPSHFYLYKEKWYNKKNNTVLLDLIIEEIKSILTR